MDGFSKSSFCFQECRQFCRSVQEEEGVHVRAQQKNKVGSENKPLVISYRCDVLLITGVKSKYVGDTEAIHREMKPGLCSIIKARCISIGQKKSTT